MRIVNGEWVWRLLRDPLIQLLLGGAILFAASQVHTHLEQKAARTIIAGGRTADRLAALYEVQTGREADAARRKQLLDDYVQDEVLYREALRLGLDQDDEIIRRRLIQKLEFLLADKSATEPSATELAAYFERHRADYAKPEAVTFRHIYFSPDRAGDAAARSRAQAALATIARDGAKTASQGDPFALQSSYVHLTELDAKQIFGNGALAAALFQAPVGRWAGPFRSGYGWHLLYVEDREAGQIPPFAAVRDNVRADFLAARRERARIDMIGSLAGRYDVAADEGG